MTVRIGSPPTNAIITSGGGTAGPNEVIAIGKERVPLLAQNALRVRQIAFSPRTGPFADYTISIDHYLEFWNTTNRDIALSNLDQILFCLLTIRRVGIPLHRQHPGRVEEPYSRPNHRGNHFPGGRRHRHHYRCYSSAGADTGRNTRLSSYDSGEPEDIYRPDSAKKSGSGLSGLI